MERAQGLRLVGRGVDGAGRGPATTCPTSRPTKPPSYVPEEGATAEDALSGTDAFIMQTDGKAWLYAPAGLADGPMPTHYEPVESPVANLLHDQQDNPRARAHRPGVEPRSTPRRARSIRTSFITYRLTEHHTAGGMSRTLPYLSELQPEFFCEVSPALARASAAWSTWAGRR